MVIVQKNDVFKCDVYINTIKKNITVECSVIDTNISHSCVAYIHPITGFKEIIVVENLKLVK